MNRHMDAGPARPRRDVEARRVLAPRTPLICAERDHVHAINLLYVDRAMLGNDCCSLWCRAHDRAMRAPPDRLMRRVRVR